MKISEIITDKYKLRIPPTVYYDLLSDVAEVEEEQEPTTKNDLGVDCVARQDVERYIEGFVNEYTPKEELEFINLELDGLKHIPSVTPQLSVPEVTALAEWTEKLTKASEDAYNKGYEAGIKALEQEPQTFKWCTDCKEYDQEKHCCHRWSKVIRDTVEEMKQEQEPILDKIKSDIAKFADTIPFVSGDIKAKYTNIGQHDGLEQALEIIEGNLKGDFDIDEWMAESE